MVILAHPDLEKSRANRALLHELHQQANIVVRELYGEYPEWKIDVAKEQRLLLSFDRIVFQFPFYWYSCPPLLKKWFDDVLTHGWAYGPEGNQLEGKEFILATTTGGPENCYRAGGDNWFTISEFLKPIQSTIAKCKGRFLPSFVAYSASQGDDAFLSREAKRYVDHIQSAPSLLVH